MTELKKYQRRLAEVCKWDPSEEGLKPSVEINNTKINHIAKDYIKDIGQAKAFEDVSGETLYNTMKTHPMGNLHLMLMGRLSWEELLKLTKEGVQDNKQYPYAISDGEEFINACRESQSELHAMAGVVSEVEIAGTELKLPDEASLTAIDALLGRAELPNLADFFVMVQTEKDIAAGVNADMKVVKAERDDTKAELERALGEMRSLQAKAEMSVQEIEIEAVGEIPEGKMVTKKASELFPDVKLITDFEVPAWEWDGPHPDVPKVDENYIFRPHLLNRCLYALITNQRAYFQGHTGSGKTTLIEQVAAHLNWPFARINFDSEITRMDLIGRDTLSTDESGKVVSKFVDGILPKVMNSAYMVCFDEIDFVRPDVAYVMQAALEGNGLRITEDGDRVVKPHPMFRMFATGNTVGQGDEHGMYQGARPQSIALLDRFTIWGEVEYLTSDQRLSLIKRHFPSMSDKDAKILNNYTTEHLEAFTGAKVIQPISPRGILAIGRAFTIIGDMREALSMTVLDRANNDDRATLKGLIDRVC